MLIYSYTLCILLYYQSMKSHTIKVNTTNPALTINHNYSKTKTLILGYIAAMGNIVLGYMLVCMSEI